MYGDLYGTKWVWFSLKGRPKLFKSDLVKVTIRIPESLKKRIEEYAERNKINFNEATRRLFLGGLEGPRLREQGFNWFQKLFEGAQNSPLFEDFKEAFIRILGEFLGGYLEANPHVFAESIAGFLGGHLKYSENVLGLDKGMLAKAVAGGNPEVQKRMSELIENMLWIMEWIHK